MALDSADILTLHGHFDAITMSNAQIDAWKAKGVDGFSIQSGYLGPSESAAGSGCGGQNYWTGNPNHPSLFNSDPRYARQRQLRDSTFVSRCHARGIKVWLSLYTANWYNPITHLEAWFDDAAWARDIFPAISDLMGMAGLYGFDGMFWDCENYPTMSGSNETWVWNYSGNTQTQTATRAKAKERGVQVMNTIRNAYGSDNLELGAYFFDHPETWHAEVQRVVNGLNNVFDNSVLPDFFFGLTAGTNWKAMRNFDAIFYKGASPAATWDNALVYDQNRKYAWMSRNHPNWAHAAKKWHQAPFVWISSGSTPFEAARTPAQVATQLDAAARHGSGREFFDYAWEGMHTSSFDYTPYVASMQSASTPRDVDSAVPSLQITGVSSPATDLLVTGRASDLPYAIRVIEWTNTTAATTGVLPWTWVVDSGSYETSYTAWHAQFTNAAIPLVAGSNSITITARDTHDNTASLTLTATPGGSPPNILFIEQAVETDVSLPITPSGGSSEGYSELVLGHANLRAFWKLADLSGSAFNSNYRNAVTAHTTSLKTYLRLGESSGTLANDETANNYDGTYVNTPTLGVTGAVASTGDKAITLASASLQHLTVAQDVGLRPGTADYSIELWLKRTSNPSASEFLVDRGGGNTGGWDMFVQSNGRLQCRIGSTGYVSTASVCDGAWHHIVWSADRNGNGIFYIDGAQDSSVSISATQSTNLNDATTMRIGARASGNYFNGSLDEVAIYIGEALSSSSVSSHFSAAQAGSPLAEDSFGTNDGTVVGGVTRGVQSGVGALAFDFNGSTGYLDVPDAAALDLGNGDFTLEAWIERDTTGNADIIIDKGAGAYVFYFDTDNKLHAGKSDTAVALSSTITITDTVPHYVVVTRSGATWKLYIDGVDRSGTVTNQTLVDTATNLRIGQKAASVLNEYFDGRMWRVAIYNAALSASDVSARYSAGGTTPPILVEQAVETDLAQSVTVSGAIEVEQAVEIDTGHALANQLLETPPTVIDQAVETDLAFALGPEVATRRIRMVV